MSRASQLEGENEAQFHLLANKISSFKNVANEISAYAQEDTTTLSGISGSMTRLGDNLKQSAHKLNRVMHANPRMTRMVGIGVGAFVVIYITIKHIL